MAVTKLALQMGPGHRLCTLLCDRYDLSGFSPGTIALTSRQWYETSKQVLGQGGCSRQRGGTEHSERIECINDLCEYKGIDASVATSR